MNYLEKTAKKQKLIWLLKEAMLPAKLPPIGSQQAKNWTAMAKKNAANMGHKARWDFNTRQTIPTGHTRPPAGGMPAPGTPKAKQWTASAKRNAIAMGHSGRRDFNRGMTLPVNMTPGAPKPASVGTVASR